MSVPPEAAPAPRIVVADVPASRGASWLGGGFAIFRAQPMAWIALSISFLVVLLAVAFIPFIGPAISGFLEPVFFASFALAAHKQLAGEKLEVTDLFLGFRSNVRTLVNLGAILLLLRIGIAFLMGAMGFPSMFESPEKMTPEDVANALDGKLWILAFGFLTVALVTAAAWFAPALIAFHGMSTSHALRWSLYAMVSNPGALAVYFLAIFLMFIVAFIPWGLGLLVALPTLFASTYVAYRNVFETPPPAAPAPTAPP
ncbi:BPSS1780 family membrane protein [Usitatibacter palustris]|uniref:Transmembrane protein n=1 Tax=Usitatibacter palustris TaxID=2732487 RepID=A0A6M4H1L6_9PROT|nr:BPSS1780 family membrane protein [Usitatibacter palustris]QJR13389.1 hypothetical protein DSM104440_00172 [Usitatibacter palustris]